MNNKSSKRTLLMSVIMSSPGPIVVGIGLLIGQSSTQLADFIRRSIELISIILAFIIFTITTKEDVQDQEKKKKLEKGANVFVSTSMILSGIIMSLLVIFTKKQEDGNVIPGLIIALLGVVANSIFWWRYTVLYKNNQNSILKIQSKLYRAKSFVDFSVTLALLMVLIFPNTDISHFFDIFGTICVSIYLIYTGIHTLIKEQ